MYDLLIRGGKLVDGSGEAGRTADVAVAGGEVVEVGRLSGRAHRTIDADGLIVTPGWVDIHTHYDGQATWDPLLDPSFSSGVTTAIVGNCGVGFAPVADGMQERLVELMDGVEEVPGSALHAGLRWNWTTFADYLDVLDATPRSFDIGALLPHGPLRLFAMGDKVGTDKCASGDDLAVMAAETERAMAAGAFGLSSSRTSVHRTASGAMTPDFHVDGPELTALAGIVARHGGILEVAPDGLVGEDFAAIRREMDLYAEIVEATGVSLHMLVLQPNLYPDFWRQQLDWAEAVTASGRARVYGQVSGRSIGALLSFFGTHPFMERQSFRALKGLPPERLLAELARPEVKARILTETDPEGSFGAFLNAHWGRCYDLGEQADYEPDESRNMVALAAASGTTPQSITYDFMLATSRHPRLLLAINNYDDSGLGRLREMMVRPSAVLGASDAGAHVMTICDGSMNTFMLTHWVRDRTRGPKLPLETVVRMMTSDTARSIGIADRGVIAPGLRADINIVDLDRLSLGRPAVVDDLPDNASRLLQDVTGYRATIVAGEVTREHDAATGAMPGRLVRRARA